MNKTATNPKNLKSRLSREVTILLGGYIDRSADCFDFEDGHLNVDAVFSGTSPAVRAKASYRARLAAPRYSLIPHENLFINIVRAHA